MGKGFSEKSLGVTKQVGIYHTNREEGLRVARTEAVHLLERGWPGQVGRARRVGGILCTC